ncbi:MAG: hypothetical protein J6V66_00920 [Clostridia bacterium]|nr:hypothetical protein [Clostridia bacterium]
MRKLKILATVLLLTILTSLLSGCVARLPIPEIKEGRFNVLVTYEINGEVDSFSGVYVCRYDGIDVTFVGASIVWEEYLENEEEIDIPIQTNKDGVVYINLGLSARYFMSEPDADYYNEPSPNLYMIFNDSASYDMEITSEEDLIASYGVKIISYDYASPIENTYKNKLKFGRFTPTIN